MKQVRSDHCHIFIALLTNWCDTGWWLVKKGGAEGWSPSNYLQLVPPTVSVRPAPPARRSPPVAPTPAASVPSAAATPKSFARAPDSSAQPVSVMPGLGNGGGLQAILAAKRAQALKEEESSSGNSSPATSRPSSGLGQWLFHYRRYNNADTC